MQVLKDPSKSPISNSYGTSQQYKIKEKAKNTPISGYCPTGCGLVYLTADKRCPSCKLPFKRKQTWDSVIKRFNVILEENKTVLDQHIPTDYEMNSLKLPIMIGHEFYSIPLRYLPEFENVMLTEEKDYASFFNYITTNCKVLKF